MTTKYRKRTIYITVTTDVILTFIASVIFEGGMSTMIQIMCISALSFTFLGTIMPLFDKFWDAIAGFFYLSAVSLPVFVIINGGINLFQLMLLEQQFMVAYLVVFAVIAYGCFGIAIVLLGKTHRMFPFWHKSKGGNKQTQATNQLGLHKIQGFRAYAAKQEE